MVASERLPDRRARLNPSTLIGMVASVLLMAVILLFASDDPLRFVDAPSIAIVLGGTLAATFLSYPLKEVLRVFHLGPRCRTLSCAPACSW